MSVMGGKFDQYFMMLPGRVIPAHAGISKLLILGDSGIRRSDLLYPIVKLPLVLLSNSYFIHP